MEKERREGQWGKKRREDGRELGNKGRRVKGGTRREEVGERKGNRNKGGRREGEERSNNQPEVINKTCASNLCH